MEKEKTRIGTIIRKELVMPFNRPFIAYEDNEIILTVELQWVKPTTDVYRVDFMLENTESSVRYKIHSLTSCRDEKEKVFYRMTLVEDKETPTFSTLSADQNILGKLDMSKGKEMFIRFNCITPDQIGRYDEKTCEFNSEKPKSKDGAIIIST